MPEDDPDTFGMLAQWIYQERLLSIDNVSGEQAEIAFQKRLALYYLAGGVRSRSPLTPGILWSYVCEAALTTAV